MKTCSLSALLLQIWRWPVVNILWQSILVVGSLPFLVPSDSWAQTLVCPADRGSGKFTGTRLSQTTLPTMRLSNVEPAPGSPMPRIPGVVSIGC